ncbi:MAG: single-stranded DNA-binding protein [Saprospiraceae bacterium]
MNAISKNLVQLTGHLGNDVQMLNFDNGYKKCSFSLAVNNSYTAANGESKKDTSWFNIVSWGKIAEQMSAVLAKGVEVGLEGKISNRKYIDKNGVNKYITEIVVSDFVVVEKTDKETNEVLT